jgi:hypothetical protein
MHATPGFIDALPLFPPVQVFLLVQTGVAANGSTTVDEPSMAPASPAHAADGEPAGTPLPAQVPPLPVVIDA